MLRFDKIESEPMSSHHDSIGSKSSYAEVPSRDASAPDISENDIEDQVNNHLQRLADHSFQFSKKKLLYGILIVFGIAIAWTCTTQFAQVAQNTVKAPFFIMWFTTSFKLLCIVPVLWHNKKQSNKTMHAQNVVDIDDMNNNNTNTDSIHGTNEKDIDNINIPTMRHLLTAVPFFYLLYVGANYSYVRALDSISASQLTVLFSSCPAWVYLLSIICLDKEMFTLRKLFAVILSIGGVIIITIDNANKNNVNMFSFSDGTELFGCILAILSAIFAASYKVMFKKIFGNMNIWYVSKFLFYLGLFNLLLMWIIVLLFELIHVESLVGFDNMPWFYLIGAALLGLTFDFLINFGIAFTYPLFISLGTIVGIPLNAIVDVVFHSVVFGVWEYVGCIAIIVAFVVLVLSR